MESGGGGNRRRRSLSDDEKIDPSDLRVKENDNSRTGLTLGTVLSDANRPRPASLVNHHRSLLDIIRDDPPAGGFRDSNKKSWRHFKDKLHLRRGGATGAAWTSTVPTPASDVPIQNNNSRMITRRNSTRVPISNSDDRTQPESSSSSGDTSNSIQSNRSMMLRRNASRIPSMSNNREGRLDHAISREGSLSSYPDSIIGDSPDRSPSPEYEDEGEEETEESTSSSAPPAEVRMSLMALLAETDREMGLDGSAYMMKEDDDEDDDEDEDEDDGEYSNCSVCVVRHKGVALTPCGHSFCRLCSKELWVQRGNCPLCNAFILEILDIF